MTDLPPTRRQLECLVMYLRTRNHENTARALGLTQTSSKRNIRLAVERLGAETPVGAAINAGWLVLPSDEELTRVGSVEWAIDTLRSVIARCEQQIRDLEAA